MMLVAGVPATAQGILDAPNGALFGGGQGNVFVSPEAKAKAETLADIRRELALLNFDIEKLQFELSTSPGGTDGNTTTLLDRVNAIEERLQVLTSKTEELEFDVQRVVDDGSRRIADLEFRLVELEGGDPLLLADQSTLGGDLALVKPSPVPSVSGAEGVTVGEAADFAEARRALAEQNYAAAAEGFADFVVTYPGAPFTADAYYFQGEALEGLGDFQPAARAYLEAFTTDQSGARAPEALFRLGRTLGALNQTREACVTLQEVTSRFPGSPVLTQVEETRVTLNCS